MAFVAVIMCLNFTSCSEEEETISIIEIAEGLTMDVFIGESKQLNVHHYPAYLDAPNYTWSSGDDSIVDIDSYTGKFTAKSVGKTTITVTAIGLQLSAQCEITVKPIETTGIAMSLKEKEMLIGEEFILTVTFTPEDATNKDLEWTSSDSNIASVDNNGKVAAIKEGECCIFAKTENGMTTECKVIVNPIEVESITLDVSEKTLEVGETFTLNYTIIPENATYKDLEWTSSDSNIASVDNNGKVTAIKEGECSIYAKSANGKNAECKVIVKPISVQYVEFVLHEIKLLVGETKRVEYNVIPSNAKITDIEWKIEDESIASISDEGIITIKNIGTTKLTVIVNGEYTAECTIIGCSIEEFISLRFFGGSIMTNNGYILPGSKIMCGMINSSTQNIIAKSIQLIDSETGSKGNVMSLGDEIVRASSGVTYTITIKTLYYQPIFRWKYVHDGKEYTIDLKYE